jgi:hypothetical protein
MTWNEDIDERLSKQGGHQLHLLELSKGYECRNLCKLQTNVEALKASQDEGRIAIKRSEGGVAKQATTHGR